MRIIDLRGTSCSGKTYVRQQFKNTNDYKVFDILDLYEKEGCIIDGKMQWNIWDTVSPQIPLIIEEFLQSCQKENKTAIIEHTNNQAISAVLNQPEYKSLVHTIRLETPSFSVLQERAEKRGLEYKNVMIFANSYQRKMVGPDMSEHTTDDAISIINDIFNHDPIVYRTGSALEPYEPSNRPSIVCHVCNDIGAWGSGFVVAISNKWAAPERAYLDWFRSGNNFELGMVQLVSVDNNTLIANMIGQHETILREPGSIPIRYKALEEALEKVAQRALYLGASVHMPRIGCARAGGDWNKVSEIIERTLISKHISTSVYTLPGDVSWQW